MTAWSPAQGRQDAFPATSAAAFFTTRQLQRTTDAQRTAPDCNARQDSTGRAAMGPSLATFACKHRHERRSDCATVSPGTPRRDKYGVIALHS